MLYLNSAIFNNSFKIGFFIEIEPHQINYYSTVFSIIDDFSLMIYYIIYNRYKFLCFNAISS